MANPIIPLLALTILLSGCISSAPAGRPADEDIPRNPVPYTRAEEFRHGINSDVPEPQISGTIEYPDGLSLNGSESLSLSGSRILIGGDISLEADSRLDISDSVIEFANEYAYQHRLIATGNSRVILSGSHITAPYPMNFEFRENSALEMSRVAKTGGDPTFPWMTFGNNAQAHVSSSKFDATLWDRADISVNDSPSLYLEIVYPSGSKSDHSFGVILDDFSFPGGDEEGIHFRVHAVNSTARGWGFTVRQDSNITIRDAHNVVMTLVADEPWENRTISLTGLREGFYPDTAWEFGDSTVRFIGVDAWQWSPLAYGSNSIIVDDSSLADIAWGGGHGRIAINNSEAFFIRARESMEIVIQNSLIHSDVIALDESTVMLCNSTVLGRLVEEGGTISASCPQP